MMLFVLTCKLQEVFVSTFEWSYVSQKVIGRMSPNLVWCSFSTDPSWVANYKVIRRGLDLVWNDPGIFTVFNSKKITSL